MIVAVCDQQRGGVQQPGTYNRADLSLPFRMLIDMIAHP